MPRFQHTNAEIAADYELWSTCYDVNGTQEEFDDLTFEQRLEMINDSYPYED